MAVYLNGNKTPEIEGEAESRHCPRARPACSSAGASDNFANLEGRICEAAVYDRALTADEVAAHYAATGLPPRPNAPAASDDKPAQARFRPRIR